MQTPLMDRPTVIDPQAAHRPLAAAPLVDAYWSVGSYEARQSFAQDAGRLLVPGETLASDERWATCDRYSSDSVSRERHLVRRGGLSTACGATASGPEVWRTLSKRSRKPYCSACVRGVQARFLRHVPGADAARVTGVHSVNELLTAFANSRAPQVVAALSGLPQPILVTHCKRIVAAADATMIDGVVARSGSTCPACHQARLPGSDL